MCLENAEWESLVDTFAIRSVLPSSVDRPFPDGIMRIDRHYWMGFPRIPNEPETLFPTMVCVYKRMAPLRRTSYDTIRALQSPQTVGESTVNVRYLLRAVYDISLVYSPSPYLTARGDWLTRMSLSHDGAPKCER